ncbi:intraflagellar transport protein 57 homolog [Macrosteles quadrilineatus]|uniref:intraflagellar transport protein 57 homolog n=1 Tax=Macrosteles quadrilineatus TaxID=74068 RepID=UPI0023E2BBF4|nr:intraflagellar transport protein 57 homolog [Macrosteles quadrilineatus]
MDLEQLSSRGSALEDPTDPSQAYQPFIIMEELMDKLKALKYDEEFIKALKMRPLNRYYFALQTNPGEQFFMFTSLAAWLVRKMGRQFEQPQEYDDPNSTIAVVLDATRDLGIPVDFAPNKLKQGYGRYAIYILNSLADKAMEHTKVIWKKPKPPLEVDTEEQPIDDEAELLLEKIEEEMAAEDSDDDEDNLLHIDDLQNITNINKSLLESQKQEEMLESNTNSEEWRLELERVLPKLKVTIKSDSRDWRAHLEQMKQYQSSLQEVMSSANSQLQHLSTDLGNSLNKIQSRDKFLNSQLESLLYQYRTVQDELAKISEQYREVSGGVSERQKTLARITDELESVKQEMEERGSSMTDGSPLVNIKKAMGRVKGDISSMNVRIGVLEYCITQARLRDKDLLQNELTPNTV